jgi:hypothetical protein
MSGRRYPGAGFKGIIFKSYLEANLTPTPKREYNAHNSTRAQIRNLRRRCKPVMDDRTPAICEMAANVITSVRDHPNPEFTALQLIGAALDASDDTGEPWLVCMQYILDKYQELADGRTEQG